VVDVFEEVEEQLRADRYKSLALRALPWVAGVLALALAVALGIWGWREYEQRGANEASATYHKAMEAAAAGDRAKANTLWGEVAAGRARGYKSLALMQQGGLKLEAGDVKGAVALFDQAAKAAPNEGIGDLARLKSALALLDTAPLKDLQERLAPLAEADRPFRPQAIEARAFAKLLAGDAGGARSDFVVLSLLSDAPQGTVQRAQVAMALIDGGGAKTVAEAVKAQPATPLLPAIPSVPAAPTAPPQAE
jgi:hypothetical protein